MLELLRPSGLESFNSYLQAVPKITLSIARGTVLLVSAMALWPQALLLFFFKLQHRLKTMQIKLSDGR